MITLRKSGDRGHFDHGWLRTYHTFSFADYRDPAHMGFRVLRVINEDWVEPGMGFPTHSHADMEIITYILEGALEHKDSMGNSSVIRRGEVQRMSAGTGVSHSEFNASKSEPVHLLQIWIFPNRPGIEPDYEQIMVPEDEKQGKLRLIASPDGRDGSVTIHQDVRLYAGVIGGGGKISHELSPERHAWIQVTRGSLDLNGLPLEAGDGAAISNEADLTISGDGEILLFDLP